MEILNANEYQLVIEAGVENLDDFNLMSETQLQSWTGISMAKVQELYREARWLVEEFHVGKKREIEEIREFRQAAYMYGISEDLA